LVCLIVSILRPFRGLGRGVGVAVICSDFTETGFVCPEKTKRAPAVNPMDIIPPNKNNFLTYISIAHSCK
jgi:hypothetical protein